MAGTGKASKLKPAGSPVKELDYVIWCQKCLDVKAFYILKKIRKEKSTSIRNGKAKQERRAAVSKLSYYAMLTFSGVPFFA